MLHFNRCLSYIGIVTKIFFVVKCANLNYDIAFLFSNSCVSSLNLEYKCSIHYCKTETALMQSRRCSSGWLILRWTLKQNFGQIFVVITAYKWLQYV